MSHDTGCSFGLMFFMSTCAVLLLEFQILLNTARRDIASSDNEMNINREEEHAVPYPSRIGNLRELGLATAVKAET